MTKILYLFFFVTIAMRVNAQNATIVINNDIQLVQLSDSLFAHVTWINSDRYGRFSCNGVIYISKGKALMVDTPMDSMQTVQLVQYLHDSLQVKLTHFIPGHHHADCIEGLDYLHSIGVESISGKLTQQKCRNLKLEVPKIAFSDSLNLNFNGSKVLCFYPGGGHATDNIVVFFKAENILFGGCFVKSMSARGIGNVSDADIEAWPKSIQGTKERFANAKYIVPGHGDIGGFEQLDHTLKLLNEYNDKHK